MQYKITPEYIDSISKVSAEVNYELLFQKHKLILLSLIAAHLLFGTFLSIDELVNNNGFLQIDGTNVSFLDYLLWITCSFAIFYVLLPKSIISKIRKNIQKSSKTFLGQVIHIDLKKSEISITRDGSPMVLEKEDLDSLIEKKRYLFLIKNRQIKAQVPREVFSDDELDQIKTYYNV